ncbi:hypothetical protein [Clostridium oryzae]|uniref:Uncharacterized protein n=1 Tax=Clostridium oryzae TaxID=1450648 RepID=A0A1V4ILD1_9CLOT|nr:hypothetical protein [Clostridium oryzae]OPJ60669.1 hypothetical protein CLORY_27200 [Clostridium oryzae]
MKKTKKIVTMLLTLIFMIAIPFTTAYAVPKKSGVDKSMSLQLTKKLKCYAYSYKGKKLSYFKSLTYKWAEGKISKKTLLKKVYGMKELIFLIVKVDIQ